MASTDRRRDARLTASGVSRQSHKSILRGSLMFVTIVDEIAFLGQPDVYNQNDICLCESATEKYT